MLAAAGLPASDLCDPHHFDASNDATPDEVTKGRDTPFQRPDFSRCPDYLETGRTVGAAILVSAAGGAAMLGEGLAGAPTPAPEVPDVVVIVHEAVRLTEGRDAHSPGGRPAPGGERHAPGGVRPASGGERPAPGGVQAADGELPAPGSGSGGAGGDEWQLGPWVSSWQRGEHRAAVEEARRAIARGDVYQVNIVGHASAPYLGDPRAALDAVAGLPGAAWAGTIEGDGWAVASGSPECLVTVSGGRVTTRPIKGTAPRTEAGRAALLASAKERAEHIMIVDLARNDLGRIATTGSVEVEELFAVRPWSGLWQAESTVSATLRPGVGVAELLRAVCPGASVTGAPKRAALEVLTRLEPVGRGPAMGALGYVTRTGIELGLTIRTVAAVAGGGQPEPAGGGHAGNSDGRHAGPRHEGIRHEGTQRSGTVHLWAGGGITWSSDPDDEVAEAAAKAAPLDAALRGAGRALVPASAGREEKDGTAHGGPAGE